MHACVHIVFLVSLLVFTFIYNFDKFIKIIKKKKKKKKKKIKKLIMNTHKNNNYLL